MSVPSTFPGNLFVAVLLLTASATACCQRSEPKDVADKLGPTVNPAFLDRSIKPGDDFFEYACGQWFNHVKIPADRAEVSPATPVIEEHLKKLQDLITTAAPNSAAKNPEAKKLTDLYNSFMDEAAIEAKGAKPMEPRLAEIAAIVDKHQLARELGKTLRADVDALNNTNFYTPNLFGMWVAPGFDDTSHYRPYLMQGGLGLPDRDYYVSDTASMKEIREKYQAYVAAMFKLAAFSEPEKRAQRVMALEKNIAEKHWTLADDNDVKKANNTWMASDFAARAPGLDWPEYFRGAGLENQASFGVWQPSAFTGESALVASEPLDSWKDWMAFHMINASSPWLSKQFEEENFAFYGKSLSGVAQESPRWKRAVYLVDGSLGDELGKLYVQKYFPPEVKVQVQAMVANLIAAYRERLKGLTWMKPSTKAEALAKLDTLYVGVGYGETWHDYSNFEVKAGDLDGNVRRGSLADYERQRARIGKQVDKKEWSMSPQTYNAVNLPLQNALNFPAAILQPPEFDPKAPTAANYGAIGAIIGHEISHTFDSEGSAFDSKGRLRNWWTPEDFAHFEAITAKLVAQYDAYKPFPDLSLNGKQTLAENIADVAGLTDAYEAYRKSLEGKAGPEVDGLTPDQQFYLAFAQSWADKLQDSALRQEVATDTHSPGRWRAATVRNSDGWYGAFGVQPGEKLYLAPEDRVQIW